MIKELELLLGSGKNSGGLCHFPKGKEYYSVLVYAKTGTRYDMETLFEKIEYARHLDLLLCADLYEQNPTLFSETDAEIHPFDSPISILGHLHTQMTPDFPEPPSVNCHIAPVDEALAPYLAPAFYIVAPIDAYSDHCIYINGTPDTSDIYFYMLTI